MQPSGWCAVIEHHPNDIELMARVCLLRAQHSEPAEIQLDKGCQRTSRPWQCYITAHTANILGRLRRKPGTQLWLCSAARQKENSILIDKLRQMHRARSAWGPPHSLEAIRPTCSPGHAGVSSCKQARHQACSSYCF